MFPWCTFLISVFVVAVCNISDLQKLEDEFFRSGTGDVKNRTWNTIFANWTHDRQSALCERALKDPDQFQEGNLGPTIVTRIVKFKCIKPRRDPVNATILKCPTVYKKYIFESGRENDCYVILTEEENSRNKDDDSVFIEKEVCGMGLM